MQYNKLKQEIIVLSGDTLSEISKKLTGKASNYLEIAKYNNITDPNKIFVGLKLVIPIKFTEPLKKEDIPTKNKTIIIDNYSKNYDYIIELDKIYYSRKGKNHWVDISDNEVARKNLYNFIGNKYNFRGYEDDERNIWDRIKLNKFNYVLYRDSVNKSQLIPKNTNNTSTKISNKRVIIPKKVNKPNINIIINNDATRFNYNLPKSPKDAVKKKDVENPDSWFNIPSLITKGINWVNRLIDKYSNTPETLSKLILPLTSISKDSKYEVKPGTFTGDTIDVSDRQYILPESIDVSEYIFGYRNRGEYTPIKSEAAPITSFSPFKLYGKHDPNYLTYIGIDKNGKLLAGNISLFGPGSYLAGTYANKVKSFSKDSNGKLKWKLDSAHGNHSRNVPILNVINENGLLVLGSLNILTTRNSNRSDTYGNITGGRVLVRVGKELRLLSGSINDIELLFELMKKRNKLEYGIFYTLDNGSYNRGLRTYDKQFTKLDLKKYDLLNNGGGNFLYIIRNTPLKFSTDTIFTPNIRTIHDNSYKKGHSLINELKGVVLHHTGFTDNNLNNVTDYLTLKNGQSAHVLINYDGSRRVLATPDKVTFHAGQSVWNNRDNVNDFMIGVEFQGDTNKSPLTDLLIQSLVEYLKPIIRQNNINIEDIVTHKLIRDLYNKLAKELKLKLAPEKTDISENDYNRIIDLLLNEVYYLK